MCESNLKVSLLGSVYSLPWLITLFIMPPLADKIGRKWIFTLSRLIECIAFVVVLSTNDYYVMMGALFTIGACASGKINVGTVYLNEWFPTRWQTFI